MKKSAGFAIFLCLAILCLFNNTAQADTSLPGQIDWNRKTLKQFSAVSFSFEKLPEGSFDKGGFLKPHIVAKMPQGKFVQMVSAISSSATGDFVGFSSNYDLWKISIREAMEREEIQVYVKTPDGQTIRGIWVGTKVEKIRQFQQGVFLLQP